MHESKATNPKDALGIKKVPMSCFSSHCAALMAESIQNQRLDCLMNDGHSSICEMGSIAIGQMITFWEGNDDVSTITDAMANVAFMRLLMMEGRLDHDRRSSTGLHVKTLNELAEKVVQAYPKCVEPFVHSDNCVPTFTVPKIDMTKVPWHVLPWRAILEAAIGMMEGGRKYGRHNYRDAGVRCSVYFDAGIRHITDFLSGTDIDPDSGLCHLTKFISCMSVLVDSIVMGNWVDDRPIRITDKKVIEPSFEYPKNQFNLCDMCKRRGPDLPCPYDPPGPTHGCAAYEADEVVPDMVEHGDRGLTLEQKYYSDRALRVNAGQFIPGEGTCPQWALDKDAEGSSGSCQTCVKASVCIGPLCLNCLYSDRCTSHKEGIRICKCSNFHSIGDDD